MNYIFRFGCFFTSLVPFYSRRHLNLFLYFKQILSWRVYWRFYSLGEFCVFFFACKLKLSLKVHVVGHLSKRKKKVCIFFLINLFILFYLFLAALGLRCCVWVFL